MTVQLTQCTAAWCLDSNITRGVLSEPVHTRLSELLPTPFIQ